MEIIAYTTPRELIERGVYDRAAPMCGIPSGVAVDATIKMTGSQAHELGLLDMQGGELDMQGGDRPWPFVYRMTMTEEDGRKWTRRLTERGAQEWREIYEGNRDYAHSRGREYNKDILIERAPVGEWEMLYAAGGDHGQARTG